MAVNGVRLVITAQQENTSRITVLHYRTALAHTWTQAELLTLATNFWANVGTPWKALCHTSVNFYSVTATDLSDDLLGQQAVYNITQPSPGLLTGDALPANVACCVSWKTPYANRRLRGRTFLYGLNELATIGSQLQASWLALAATWATGTLAFFNTIGLPVAQCVYSRSSNVMTPITTFLIDNITDSQRRRLPNRGA